MRHRQQQQQQTRLISLGYLTTDPDTGRENLDPERSSTDTEDYSEDGRVGAGRDGGGGLRAAGDGAGDEERGRGG